nr:hypothetical protein [Tanacetum cinerariifolium]
MNLNSNDENEYVSKDDDESDIWFMTKAIEMHAMKEQEERGQTSNSRNLYTVSTTMRKNVLCVTILGNYVGGERPRTE